jgi:hypothetical protein
MKSIKQFATGASDRRCIEADGGEQFIAIAMFDESIGDTDGAKDSGIPAVFASGF